MLESIEVVFAGKEKKDKVLSARDKKITAYHEIGHALLTVLLKRTNPIQKITIVPRMMGSLGYVWHTPAEEKNHMTQAEMEAQIVISAGGRAAEALKFPTVTAGAMQDIEDATKYARTMVTMYGMSEKLGMVQYEAVTGEYLDKRRVLQCSDETQTLIDNEVREIINRAYIVAYSMLSQHLDVMDKLAEYLVEHETISGEQFMTIYNEITGSNLPVKKELDSKGFAIESEELYNVGIVNPQTDGLKEKKKLKDKSKKLKADKKAKKAAKAAVAESTGINTDSENKDKYKVYASPEFEAKRAELLEDINDEIEDVEESTDKPFESMTPFEDSTDSSDSSDDSDTTSNSNSDGSSLPWQ